MICYASRTGTRRNLEALRAHNWRLMVTPQRLSTEGMPYALDNGAWSAYCTGRNWDRRAFRKAVDTLGNGADFIVLPDIVAGGLDSLFLSLEWLDRFAGWPGLLLLAVQDGMMPAQVMPFLSKRVGIFVGGSTEWKLASLPQWAELAHKLGVYIHVGRVNTARRIRYCSGFGVHSIDGTSASRYADTLALLDFARRQHSFDFVKMASRR